MVSLSPAKRSLFWGFLLLAGVLDFLIDFGIHAILFVLETALYIHWLNPWLVLAAGFDSALAPTASLINIVIVTSICFVAINHVIETTGFANQFDSVRVQLLTTFILVLLYLLFSITNRGYPAFLPEMQYQTSAYLFVILLFIASILPFTFAYARGIISGYGTEQFVLADQTGPTIAAGYLLTGGLATLGTINFGLAILAILVSITRLTDYELKTRIAPEEGLVQVLRLLEQGPLGFAVVFAMLTGLFVIAESYKIVMVGWPFVYIWMLESLLTKYVAIAIVSFFLYSGFLLLASVLLLKLPSWPYNLVSKALVYVVSLWVLLASIFLWQSVIGPEELQYGLNEPVVYAVFLATGIVGAGVVHNRIDPNWIYYSLLAMLAMYLGPFYLEQSIYSSVGFLNFAIIGYWGGPTIERLGFAIAKVMELMNL